MTEAAGYEGSGGSGRLAARVKNVLKKQVCNKGYEVQAILIKKEGGNGLGITDDGSGVKTVFSIPVSIIITSHDIEQFPMELGDNPEDILDFVWLSIEDGEEVGSEYEVDEGLVVKYGGNDYVITAANPVSIGGKLIIKECRAKKVR